MELNKPGSKNLFIGIIVIIIVVFLVFLGNRNNPDLDVLSGNDIQIIFTEDGFSPETIAVSRGSTITFVNKSNQDFWPASNLHPTHEIFPEFDSLEELPPESSWSFEFKEEGRFQYHDHLSSNMTGVIIVVDENLSQIKNTGLDCSDLENVNKFNRTACLEEYMREVSSDKGIVEALEVLADGFQNDPIFADNCHALAHVIGEEAYNRFTAGKKLDADERTTYCGYGFYHGFMERLLILENDLNKAREFCTYLDQEVMQGRGNVQLACFHGIGHGFVDGAEKKAWGDEWALTGPALKLCDRVSTNELEEYRCFSGVFNSLSIAYSSNLYGLILNEEDPLWICREQKEERYKLGCYTDMMVALMTLEDDDLAKASKYLLTIENEHYLDRSMYTLSSLAVRQNLDTKNLSHIVDICHSLGESLQLQCIKGFSGGLMEFGEPEKEYIKASSFCGEEKLSEYEKSQCFESIIDYAHFSYPEDRLKKACDMINGELRSERVRANCAL